MLEKSQSRYIVLADKFVQIILRIIFALNINYV